MWFVENFLSLHRQSHPIQAVVSALIGCDLSKISYLCTDNHTIGSPHDVHAAVVICRKFLIFAQTITPPGQKNPATLSLWFVENFLSLHRQSHLDRTCDLLFDELWFVENFLSLHRQSHQLLILARNAVSCDLSKISYLCTDNHTLPPQSSRPPAVVICRKFLIFAQTITPTVVDEVNQALLWFVENFLSLHRQSHQISYLSIALCVVICRKFLIFAQTITPRALETFTWLMLWFVENFLSLHRQSHLCIEYGQFIIWLWFVENFLSLHRQSHQRQRRWKRRHSCDLSKISYLCTDNHTFHQPHINFILVVICRKFLIFAQTITPLIHSGVVDFSLWFVENFLSLHRQSHPPRRQAMSP